MWHSYGDFAIYVKYLHLFDLSYGILPFFTRFFLSEIPSFKDPLAVLRNLLTSGLGIAQKYLQFDNLIFHIFGLFSTLFSCFSVVSWKVFLWSYVVTTTESSVVMSWPRIGNRQATGKWNSPQRISFSSSGFQFRFSVGLEPLSYRFPQIRIARSSFTTPATELSK